MNEPELIPLLKKYEISPQKRCLDCPFLGALAIKLSEADELVTKVGSFIDPQEYIETMRPGVVLYMVNENPHVTVEEIDEELRRLYQNHVDNGDQRELMRNLGALHEYYGEQAAGVVHEINTLLETCPPEGHARI